MTMSWCASARRGSSAACASTSRRSSANPGCGINRALEGRTALVTGGAEGIGRAACLALATQGARVAVHYRSRQAAALATASEVRSLDAQAVAVKGDLASPDAALEVRASVERELGPIDILVNNAGRYRASSAAAESPEDLAAMLRDNLQTTFNSTWAVRDTMLKRRFGRIVNIASTAAFFRSTRTPPAYGAAKAAVVALTKAWAAEWGPSNVRVNCIAPGFIDTEANGALAAEVRERIVSQTPLGRIGESAEVADAIVFLVSEASAFVNGQTLSVCGGRVMLP